MANVLILLSTYNGEKYLAAQLESLYAQENVDIHILVRDDGSKDNTIRILNEFSSKFGKMTILAEKNIGAAKSFYTLIKYAYEKCNDYDYYAFCDQDDFWFPNKLNNAVFELDYINDKYKLYFSNSTITDENLKELKPFYINYSSGLIQNIISNKILGCTQVYNRELLNLVSKIFQRIDILKYDNYLPLHDVWVSLVAYAFGVDIKYSLEPSMFYRQHSNNVIGANTSCIEKNYLRFKRNFTSNRNTKSSKCKLLYNIYKEELPTQSIALIKKVVHYNDSLTNKFKLISSFLKCQISLSTKLGCVISIFLGKF